MKMNAHIERLIVRKLDGEISESELLELNRELLRSADVRAVYESYCEIDDLAADVIRSSARGSGETLSTPVLKVRHEVVAHQPRHHKWMIYASGLAACLALVLIWKTPGSNLNMVENQPPTISRGSGWDNPILRNQPMDINQRDSIPAHEVGIWNVADLPKQRLDRTTDQNLILVPTKDGGYYLMYMDRIRQVRQPQDQAESLRWNRPI